MQGIEIVMKLKHITPFIFSILIFCIPGYTLAPNDSQQLLFKQVLAIKELGEQMKWSKDHSNLLKEIWNNFGGDDSLFPFFKNQNPNVIKNLHPDARKIFIYLAFKWGKYKTGISRRTMLHLSLLSLVASACHYINPNTPDDVSDARIPEDDSSNTDIPPNINHEKIQKIVAWINGNSDPNTGMPYSFHVPENVLYETAENNIQRILWAYGASIYDSALAQILWSKMNSESRANNITDTYWNNTVRPDFMDLRAYFVAGDTTHPFRYSEEDNGSFINQTIPGERGLIFHLLPGNGFYSNSDPLGEGPIGWMDWQPIVGGNAWAGIIGPMQTYYNKYGTEYVEDAIELKLAEEIARASLLLKSDETHGIRMAPMGTWHESNDLNYYFNRNCIENNLSLYAGYNMLFNITGKQIYQDAMNELDIFLKSAFNGTFRQSLYYTGAIWEPNQIFATDCQTWAVLTLGPQKIDTWGEEIGISNATYEMLRETIEKAGIFNTNGQLQGLDFTRHSILQRNPMISIEWSVGGVLALRQTSNYYETISPELSEWLRQKAQEMSDHLDSLAQEIDSERIGYSYATGTGNASEREVSNDESFNWVAPSEEILSVASTTWMAFKELSFNPMILGGGNQEDYLAMNTTIRSHRPVNRRAALLLPMFTAILSGIKEPTSYDVSKDDSVNVSS